MSLNRRMKTATVEELTTTQSASGATKTSWEKSGSIRAAVHAFNGTQVAALSVKYELTTHLLLTPCRELVAGKHRVIQDGVTYEPTFVNNGGARLAQVYVKVVS